MAVADIIKQARLHEEKLWNSTIAHCIPTIPNEFTLQRVIKIRILCGLRQMQLKSHLSEITENTTRDWILKVSEKNLNQNGT